MGMIAPRRAIPASAGLGESSLFTSGLTINPTLLLVGLGFLVLAGFMFGSSPERIKKVRRKTAKRKRRKRIGEQIERLKKEEKELGGWF